MIKRVIFDLDDTLIKWDDSYYDTLDKTLNYYNIKYDNNIKNNLIKAVDDYESKYVYYNMQDMNNLMKEYTNLDLPDDFVYRWTLFLEDCVPSKIDNELIDILDYLSNKYELVVLTNWFLDEQVNRLKKCDILKYFNEVIATEKVKNKPNKEAYIKACGPNLTEECIMIGDSLNKDIIPALENGLDAILYDYNYKNHDNIKKVNKLIELKKYL